MIVLLDNQLYQTANQIYRVNFVDLKLNIPNEVDE